MSTFEKARQQLVQLFKRKPIAELGDIKKALGSRSRSTALRVLLAVGYFTSYSHAGRYYTLKDIPVFDDDGLWSHGDALCSKYGTLRATIVELVEKSPAGMTHADLQQRLHLRVHDTLRQLTNDKQLDRILLGSAFVYISSDKSVARVQQDHRQQVLEPKLALVSTSSPQVVIEVLSVVVQNTKAAADPVFVAKRLRQRGISVTAAEVEKIFEHHGVKKTAPPRSRRSRR